MDSIKSLFQDMGDMFTHPFKNEYSIVRVLLALVLFSILAYIMWDMLKLLKSWSEVAIEAVADAAA
jgi:hypothetical protein